MVAATVEDNEIPSESSPIERLLIPEEIWLDPAYELRRKFGSKVAGQRGEEGPSELPDSIPSHIRGRMRNPHHRKAESVAMKGQLIMPRPTWARVTAAVVEMRLEPLEHPDYGADAYQLVPSASYLRQFEAFTALVEAGDVQLMYRFVQKNPLHVDGLLVVSDIFRMSSTTDSGELTERALHVLEKCLLKGPSAKVPRLTSGKLRLPYEVPDNRRVHLALFRYVQFLVKRGCYRTALEVSKVLLSLDYLVDPLSIRLLMDFLAFQSDQLQWFYEFMFNVDPWMANWDFTFALWAFRNKEECADVLLIEAISSFPWMVPRLANVSGLQVDESFWNVEAEDVTFSALEAISKIYSARSAPLWKDSQVSAWFETCMGQVKSLRLALPYPEELICPVVGNTLPLLRHTVISDLPNVNVVILRMFGGDAPVRMYDPLPAVVDVREEWANERPSSCIIA